METGGMEDDPTHLPITNPSRQDSHRDHRDHSSSTSRMDIRTSQGGGTAINPINKEAGETIEARGRNSKDRADTGDHTRSGMRTPKGISSKQERMELQRRAVKY